MNLPGKQAIPSTCWASPTLFQYYFWVLSVIPFTKFSEGIFYLKVVQNSLWLLLCFFPCGEPSASYMPGKNLSPSYIPSMVEFFWKWSLQHQPLCSISFLAIQSTYRDLSKHTFELAANLQWNTTMTVLHRNWQEHVLPHCVQVRPPTMPSINLKMYKHVGNSVRVERMSRHITNAE